MKKAWTISNWTIKGIKFDIRADTRDLTLGDFRPGVCQIEEKGTSKNATHLLVAKSNFDFYRDLKLSQEEEKDFK